MKVLFLDVDGVLNYARCQSRNPHGCYGVEDDKVELLRKVVKETDCMIVISSTWRKWDDCMEYLKEKLGDLAQCIVGQTPAVDSTFMNRRNFLGLLPALAAGFKAACLTSPKAVFLNLRSYELVGPVVMDLGVVSFVRRKLQEKSFCEQILKPC